MGILIFSSHIIHTPLYKEHYKAFIKTGVTNILLLMAPDTKSKPRIWKEMSSLHNLLDTSWQKHQV